MTEAGTDALRQRDRPIDERAARRSGARIRIAGARAEIRAADRRAGRGGEALAVRRLVTVVTVAVVRVLVRGLHLALGDAAADLVVARRRRRAGVVRAIAGADVDAVVRAARVRRPELALRAVVV